jgi:hypothetical protein
LQVDLSIAVVMVAVMYSPLCKSCYFLRKNKDFRDDEWQIERCL